MKKEEPQNSKEKLQPQPARQLVFVWFTLGMEYIFLKKYFRSTTILTVALVTQPETNFLA